MMANKRFGKLSSYNSNTVKSLPVNIPADYTSDISHIPIISGSLPPYAQHTCVHRLSPTTADDDMHTPEARLRRLQMKKELRASQLCAGGESVLEKTLLNSPSQTNHFFTLNKQSTNAEINYTTSHIDYIPQTLPIIKNTSSAFCQPTFTTTSNHCNLLPNADKKLHIISTQNAIILNDQQTTPILYEQIPENLTQITQPVQFPSTVTRLSSSINTTSSVTHLPITPNLTNSYVSQSPSSSTFITVPSSTIASKQVISSEINQSIPQIDLPLGEKLIKPRSECSLPPTPPPHLNLRPISRSSKHPCQESNVFEVDADDEQDNGRRRPFNRRPPTARLRSPQRLYSLIRPIHQSLPSAQSAQRAQIQYLTDSSSDEAPPLRPPSSVLPLPPSRNPSIVQLTCPISSPIVYTNASTRWSYWKQKLLKRRSFYKKTSLLPTTLSKTDSLPNDFFPLFQGFLSGIRTHLRSEDVKMEESDASWAARRVRIMRAMKLIIAHLCSTTGLCMFVMAYCFLGALIFEYLERDHNLDEIQNMINYRNDTVYALWRLTRAANVLKEMEWTNNASDLLEIFEKEVIKKVELSGYSGNVTDKWDFSESLLFSITVVTTIGYGHIAPKTFWGRFITIFYALFGIPVTLICLHSLGSIMANTFRFIYNSLCCYPCNYFEEKTQKEKLGRVRKEIEARKTSKCPTIELEKPFPIDSTENTYQEVRPTRAEAEAVYGKGGIIVRLLDNDVVFEKAVLTKQEKQRVPVKVVLSLVFGYIALGGLLFSMWESDGKTQMTSNEFFKWAYFCFITLTTIGFGDIVPGNSIRIRQNHEGNAQMLFCCLYLVIGLALIAMSLNLVKDEFIFKLKRLARRFGFTSDKTIQQNGQRTTRSKT